MQLKHRLAQGSTEYLILLAVVLIVALVSIALLGFFPGLSSDAQLAQSQAYWKSSSPIAIEDIPQTGYYATNTSSVAVFIVKNNGQYRITLSKILTGESGHYTTLFNDCTGSPCVMRTLSEISLSPGETVCFGYSGVTPASCARQFAFYADNLGLPNNTMGALTATTLCGSDGTGIFNVKNFGFEYSETIDGLPITKRFIGSKPLVSKCTGRYP